MPQFQIELRWTGQQLWDYLNTWSAIKHYQDQMRVSALADLQDILLIQQPMQVTFPILLRVGRQSI